MTRTSEGITESGIATFDDVVDRLAEGLSPDEQRFIRGVCGRIPDDIKGQFVAANGISNGELGFVFGYAEYYLKTRGDRIIPAQFFWSTKYAFTIAPLMAALYPDFEFHGDSIGEIVEYSFAGIRDSSKPDPADYDIELIYGAVIVKLRKYYGTDYAMMREIGASWRTVAAYWDQLKHQDEHQILEFVRNIANGGSAHLADGLL